jgi:Tol biopolymer transport system component
MNARRARILPVVAALAGACATSGCFPVAGARLPQDVGAALAAHPMRRLETDDMLLFYPEGREIEAWRFLTRVEACVAHLRQAAQVHNSVADQKIVTILPELPFNNAFVMPRIAGYNTLAVIPTYQTLNEFSLEFGLPPDPAIVGCHEITHYVQFQQIAGFAWFWNLFGEVYTPQIGLDSWFSEGLAVYYETKLQPGTGRLAWPFWRGAFAAGFAGKRFGGGDLSAFQRDFHAGSNYLTGSQFVRFLADRYGEDKLWKLINIQARSIFFPLFVNVRFWQAYDKSLSTLIDEFADEVSANLTNRSRPVDQRVVRPAGHTARYARAPDGTEALLATNLDRPAWLAVYGPDGRLRSERDLTDVLPPRKMAIAAPTLASGLSFSSDGRWLYFVAVDLDATYQASRLYRYDIDAGTIAVVAHDLRGPGGSLSPDGSRYLFARADGDRHDLAELDIATGAVRVIAQEPHGAYIANPRYAPDGRRVVATRFDGQNFRIVLLNARDGGLLATLPTGDDPVHDASWVDDHRIVFLAGAAGDAGFQVYDFDLDSGRSRKLTNAPFLAFQPSAADGRTLRFLNREGWHWTLDEIALPPRDASTSGAPTQVAAAPPVTPVPPAATIATNMIPTVTSDTPARRTDHLFVPQLYGPTLAYVGRAGTFIGAVLSGGDRLEVHRWALAGYYQLVATGHGGGSVGYSNRQLAPLTLSLAASHFSFADVPPVANTGSPTASDFTLLRRESQLTVDALRLFYQNPVSAGFAFIESWRPADPAVLDPLLRIAGPHLSAAYTGAATSPYTGASRLFFAAIDVAAYPRDWNSAGFGFYDLRGELAVILPLPFNRRHTLLLDGRGRDLAGSPAGEGLLRVGGYFLQPLARQADRPERVVSDYPFLPPGAVFVEPLRGFEDYPLAVDRIGIGSARYRLPFIIDNGWASTLGVLPALFIQQINLELFGVAASDARQGGTHTAAGGSLALNLAFWVIPITIQYQLARRFTDDQAFVHLVQIGL